MKHLKTAILSLGLLFTGCNSVVLLDRVPPVVTVTSPVVSTQATYVFKGTLQDNLEVKSASYRLNGGPVQTLPFDAEGGFQVTLTLQPGDNTIVLEARDADANTTTRLHKVQFQPPAPVDTTPPVVLVYSGVHSTQQKYRLQGTIGDLSGIQESTYQLNGGPAVPLPLNTYGEFGVDLQLRQGLNTIVLKATDPRNNTTTVSHVVEVPDTVRPAIVFTSPGVSSSAQYTFTGTITDNVQVLGATYQLNGGPALPLPLDSNGHFSMPVTLVPGQNILTVVARDDVGSNSLYRYVLNEAVDLAPVLSSIFPAQGIEAGGSLVTLKGTSLKNATEVRINGVSVPFEARPQGELRFISPEGSKGNVQVTVTTPAGTSNPLTFKYVPFGIWQFGTPSYDLLGGMDTDDQDNFYAVVDWFGAVLLRKHAPNGKVLWEKGQLGMWVRDMEVTQDGSIYLAGEAGPDAVVKKLDLQGNVLWTGVASTPHRDTPWDLEVDAQGNAYLTGLVGITEWDLVRTSFVAKFDKGGQLSWLRDFPNNTFDAGTLAVDGNLNVYVGGYSPVPNSNDTYRATLVKFDAQGIQQWIRTSASPEREFIHDIAFNSKNEYVVSYSSGKYQSGTLVKYLNDDQEQWNRPGGSQTHFLNLQYNAADQLAFTQGRNVVKLDPAGTELLNKPLPFDGRMRITPSGTIFLAGTTTWHVGGYINPGPGTPDVVLARLDSNGDLPQ